MVTLNVPPDFKEFLRLLADHRVEYLLVGGYAVGYHGYPRATADMDIWIAVNPQNAHKLVAALKDFGFDTSELSPELFLQEGQIVRMGVQPMRIEIMTSATGVKFDECYKTRVVDELDGVTTNIIDLDHLKINKNALGRYKDLADVENLP
ncbi:MAG: hypothetical protein MUP30_08215 [Deltaproteobacteria bacterium]|jgi:hypothetical protein|nr:hypothetical protein [Deltaproteobacteria bacterium]